MILRNWIAALLVAGISCGFTACSNDDKKPNVDPETRVVLGDYSGTMQFEEKEPATVSSQAVEVSASIVKECITFEDFPIRDLVVRIIGEEGADELVEAIGKVGYTIPYGASMSADRKTIALALRPEALKLKIADQGSEALRATDEPDSTQIEVTIDVVRNGTFTVQTGELEFCLSVQDVKIDGMSMDDLEPFSLDFHLTKHNQ